MPFSTPHNNVELLVGRQQRGELIRADENGPYAATVGA